MTVERQYSRLTDAALIELEDIALLRLSEADRAAGARLDDRAALELRDQAARHYFVNLVLEVKERRALDLSSADVKELRALGRVINRGGLGLEDRGGYLGLIDRILAANGAKPT